MPQGSTRELLPFSLYINDMPSILCSSHDLYADDVQLYRSCKLVDVNVRAESLYKELDKISKWVSDNRLTIHVKKSQGNLKKNICSTSFPQLVLNGETILYQEKVKNLEVILNKTLSWK